MMENEETWLLFEKDGRHHQVRAPKGEKPHNPRRLEAVKVDRHTLDPTCESFDRARGEWVVDTEKRARLDEEARILTMTGAQVYAELAPRIDALAARIVKLEGGIE